VTPDLKYIYQEPQNAQVVTQDMEHQFVIGQTDLVFGKPAEIMAMHSS
jgi:hypothetical protein